MTSMRLMISRMPRRMPKTWLSSPRRTLNFTSISKKTTKSFFILVRAKMKKKTRKKRRRRMNAY